MNRQDVTRVLPLLEAFAKGKKIQFKTNLLNWEDTDTIASILLFPYPERYRIKPESKTVPLTIEDLYEHFKKGTIFKSSAIGTDLKCIITALTSNNIYTGHGFNYIDIEFRKLFCFEDGSPLTKIVEE